jgi:hypothetical protein
LIRTNITDDYLLDQTHSFVLRCFAIIEIQYCSFHNVANHKTVSYGLFLNQDILSSRLRDADFINCTNTKGINLFNDS